MKTTVDLDDDLLIEAKKTDRSGIASTDCRANATQAQTKDQMGHFAGWTPKGVGCKES
jgi:hypothetical protein